MGGQWNFDPHQHVPEWRLFPIWDHEVLFFQTPPCTRPTKIWPIFEWFPLDLSWSCFMLWSTSVVSLFQWQGSLVLKVVLWNYIWMFLCFENFTMGMVSQTKLKYICIWVSRIYYDSECIFFSLKNVNRVLSFSGLMVVPSNNSYTYVC